MEHSNRKIEEDLELARLNKEYVEAKRAELKVLRPQGELFEHRPKKRARIYCCVALVLVIGICGYIIYFFVSSIKSDVVNDYYDKKAQMNATLPQVTRELNTSIDQGTNLYNETAANVKNIQEQYNKAKTMFETVSGWYDKVKNFMR
ncbi:MAG: hypothetical protein V1928_01865 [Parcubacteria group bacterium]